MILWHPEAEVECASVQDPAERVAIQHVRDKLEALGPTLSTPHSSAIKGKDGAGLRELRPRGGRSRWRPIYKRVRPGIFVILAIAPEAQIDKRRFDESIRHAKSRLDGLDA